MRSNGFGLIGVIVSTSIATSAFAQSLANSNTNLASATQATSYQEPSALASVLDPIGPSPATESRAAEPWQDEIYSLRDDNRKLHARIAALESNQPTASPSDLLTSSQSLAAQAGAAPTVIASNAWNSGPTGAWVGGMSVYVLKPHWSSGNTAYYNSSPASPVNPNVFTTTQFPTPYQAAPAFWFGYVHASGYGIRTNFFYYNQSWGSSGSSSATTDVIDATGQLSSTNGAPGVPTAFNFASSLAITSWDLEGTRTIANRDWTCTASAGLRYLYMQQKYSAQTDGGGFSAVNARNMFNGFGPTTAISARRRIGWSGLGFYSAARGALLFGRRQQTLTTNDGSLVSEGYLSGSSQADYWGLMPFGQIEFGLDYRRPINYGRAMLLIENGVVGQAYFNAGTPSNTNTTFFPTNQQPSSLSDSTLGMFGLRSSIGFTF